jgi:hypothetical protein
VNRLAPFRRDLRIVAHAVWANLALFAALLLAAAGLLRLAGCYARANCLDLIVVAFNMAHLERVAEPGDGLLPAILTFVVPLLTAVILGEGVLRVLSVFVQRREHQEEWEIMVARTFEQHTVICGVGELGRAIFRRLIAADPDAQVVLVDTRPGIAAELGLGGVNVCHVQADMTSQATLQAAHCDTASLIILACGNDAYNLEAGFKALQMNPQAQIWIRLYHSGLASLMDVSRKPNVHFFCPYERAAEALVTHLQEAKRCDAEKTSG